MDNLFAWVEAFADSTPVLGLAFFALGFANVFLPPVPIESLALFGGYLTGSGHGSVWMMWLAVVAGMSAGSFILYIIATKVGERLLQFPIIKRFLSPAALTRAQNWFAKYGVWTLYFGKLVPGMSFATVLASGLFMLERRVTWNAIFFSNTLYFAALLAIGHYLGKEWLSVIELIRRYDVLLVVLLLLVISVAALVYIRRRSQREKTDQQS